MRARIFEKQKPVGDESSFFRIRASIIGDFAFQEFYSEATWMIKGQRHQGQASRLWDGRPRPSFRLCRLKVFGGA